MALEGNLTDFGLSEIFQLIGVQQKSGMLLITSEERSMVLFFRDGKAISTRDRRRKNKDPFKDYVTRYGIIHRNDLIRIMQISAQSKMDLTEIIVSENFLTDEAMKKHFRCHIQEAVYEVLTWQQCSYKFMPGKDIIAGLKTWGEYNLEGLLMESMRRIDEFPQMLKEFPDQKMFISHLVEADVPEDLTANEKTILELLDQERTLNYLIAHSKMPSFETYEALKHLKEKELIDCILDQPEGITDKYTSVRDSSSIRSRIAHLAPFSFILFVFLLSAAAGYNSSFPRLRAAVPSSLYQFKDVAASRARMAERVKWLLEGYRASKGIYPRSLESLEAMGFVSPEVMTRIKQFSFRYHLTPGGNKYTLL